MRRFFGVLLLLLMAAPAMAGDVRPKFLESYIHSELPLGHATYRKLFIRVYDANLWTDAGAVDYKLPFALTLTYHVSIESWDFVDRTIDEMAHVSGKSKEELDHFRAKLGPVFPNVKAGDSITALHVPGKPVQFFFNGEKKGEIGDKHFSEMFFGVWLSEKTSEPAFRQALLNN